ncbi:head-tail connector protein [Primorskyibacter sp. S87]|uniref:head-tail connector protein n=1 Tax=Primorskyibacter sp. S87 TaxID=3415126 RepID=UPI003C7B2318
MMLIEETTVPDAALPVEQFKSHLRLGTGFAEDDVQDAVLHSFLRAAVAAIEARTGKVLIAREFSWTVNGWRDRSGEVLPVGPVRAVTRIVLCDATGSETVLDQASYRLEQDGQRPRLRPAGALLPTIATGGSAKIVMDVGLANEWGGLPADLVQAVLLLAAHYYEYRNETSLGDGCMPFGVTSLIQRYRTLRIGAAR